MLSPIGNVKHYYYYHNINFTWKGCQGHSHPLVRGEDTEGSLSEELGISSEDINKYSLLINKDSLNNE